ncbi:MAG: endonuclease/exonuclease/phosphatase family protein [Verrucomicrobiota bacterium]
MKTRSKTKVILPLQVAFFVAFLGGFEVRGQSSEDSAPEKKPITIVFYNVKNYLGMDRRIDGEVVEGAGKPESEIEALVGAILEMKPDILGLCEIGDSPHLDDLQSRLKSAGIDLPHRELVADSGGYDRNLALLSSFPIVATASRDDYTYSIPSGTPPHETTTLAFQRGVLDATIRVTPTYHLRYIGLHLKSKREVPEADQALMRLNEARLARQHIDRIFEAEPGVNLLVMGDFNDLRIEPPVKALQGGFGRRGFLSSLTLSDSMGFRWTHHWSYADSYSRFDYTLYSEGISSEIQRDQSFIFHWDDWDKASDHRALVVRVVPEDR